MELKESIMSVLSNANGEYVTGEELGERFGVTRSAVWKAINSLKKSGVQIDSVKSRGYILSESYDYLSEREIKKYLKNDIDIAYYKTIDSTNNEAKRLLANGLDKELLIVSNEQTAGRGRQGKSFYSPKDTGVYFSLVIFPKTTLQNAVTSTTAAAVAVCRAIEKLCKKSPEIKWVNDVYLDGAKVCGILTEAVSDFETQTVNAVIIGIGINNTTTNFPREAGSAGAVNAGIKRSELAACITDELLKIACSPYNDFIDYYRSRSMIIGKDIYFIKDGVKTNARATGIDETGGLEIVLENGEKTVLRSGDITVRKYDITKGLD